MVWRKTIAFVLLFATAVMLTRQAQAVIVSTSGAMVEISAPASFVPEALESSTEIVILDEGSQFLPGDAFLNAFGPGPHTDSGAPLLMVPAGTLVNTYFVHFDPDGGVVSLTGGVVFEPDEVILGIQTHTPLIDSTDAIGDPTPAYPTAAALTRGFEFLPGIDTVTIDPSLGAASFSLIAELGVDQARIFTIVVPEPSTLILLALGVVTVAGCALRQYRRDKLPGH